MNTRRENRTRSGERSEKEDKQEDMTGQDSYFNRPLPRPKREAPFLREPELLPLAFERTARVCHWWKEERAVWLAPLLTGKARSAYVAMDVDCAEEYGKVKEDILIKYEITADTYGQRFRSFRCFRNFMCA